LPPALVNGRPSSGLRLLGANREGILCDVLQTTCGRLSTSRSAERRSSFFLGGGLGPRGGRTVAAAVPKSAGFPLLLRRHRGHVLERTGDIGTGVRGVV